jgi:molybdenum cofactor cytidylyltransferase
VTPTRLEAVVLAAGAGARFGGAKLSAPWRGGVLIDGALQAALAAPVQRVIVVTGIDPAVAKRVEALGDPRLALVHAADHALGMSASLRAGLAATSRDVAGVFVFLGDMPLVPYDIAGRLAAALEGGALAAAPACDGRRGHPALFTAALFSRLVALKGDVGARDILDGLGERLVLVETDDPGVLADVDRPEDLHPNPLP